MIEKSIVVRGFSHIISAIQMLRSIYELVALRLCIDWHGMTGSVERYIEHVIIHKKEERCDIVFAPHL